MKKLTFFLSLTIAFNIYAIDPKDLTDVDGLVKITSHSGFTNPDRLIDESITSSAETQESSSSSVTFEITMPTTIESLKIIGKSPYCTEYGYMYVILSSITISDKNGHTLFTLPAYKELNGSFEDITDISKDNVKYITLEFYTGYCADEDVGTFYDIQINGTDPTGEWTYEYYKIYTQKDSVGIGSSDVTHELTVNGTGSMQRILDYDNESYFLDPSNPATSMNVAGMVEASGLRLPDGTTIQHRSDLSNWTISEANIFRPTGFVGIGTPDVTHELTVNGTGKLSSILDYDNESYFLDPSNPATSMNVAGMVEASGLRLPDGTTIQNRSDLSNWTISDENIFRSSGFVGIGTSNVTHELTVKGTIKAEELIIEDVAADFVFSKEYNLRSLGEVSVFIQENGHLPDIAPASETQKGIKVSEFNTLLLQKIEELTLYMIEMKQENEQLRKDIQLLKEEQ